LENKNLMVVIMGAISAYLQLEQPVRSQPAPTQPQTQPRTSFWQTLKSIFSSSKGT
jgi:hypothetical protein